MTYYEHDKLHWEKEGIAAELEFHKKNKWRQSKEFYTDSLSLFKKFHLSENSFEGKTILDAGCGSKLRTKVFKGAEIIALDPLALSFVELVEWCDLTDAVKVFSIPLEEYEESLEETVDAIICINVIDHGFQYRLQLENMAHYLKIGADLFLAVDIGREKPDLKHNSIEKKQIIDTLQKNNITVLHSKTDKETFDKRAKERLLLIGRKI